MQDVSILKAELNKYKRLYFNLCGNKDYVVTPSSPKRSVKVQNDQNTGSKEIILHFNENKDENCVAIQDIQVARQLLGTFSDVSGGI
jgi:hypothetical protein